MANVIKIIKGAAKAKKSFTKGKDKAVMRASQTYDSNTKGLGLTKGSNKDYKNNEPKMQRKYNNLRKGSNTTKPSSIAKFPNQTKPVPVKKSK